MLKSITIIALAFVTTASAAFAGECTIRPVSQRGINGCNFIFSDAKGAAQSFAGYNVNAETCSQAAAELINSDISTTKKILVDSNGRDVSFEAMGMSQWDIDNKIWWGTWKYEEKRIPCHASRANFEYKDGKIKVTGTVQND